MKDLLQVYGVDRIVTGRHKTNIVKSVCKCGT